MTGPGCSLPVEYPDLVELGERQGRRDRKDGITDRLDLRARWHWDAWHKYPEHFHLGTCDEAMQSFASGYQRGYKGEATA